ncbi:YkvI family membrane protein [Parahaliea mediterranea]|uniref:GerAB/ArcD/ProY family transporter n=1 Tax=Parahaliea mediterranea TaxID=651086 RepID=A0A939IL84_9GAMM|nr:hypothetical protein [Parahaliea mediterranea]MBN7798121.1 hypothetical protein [Parahaliea mediterranea]
MAWFRTFILPGLIFQSVIIGGGYATGRELIEFFFPQGPLGGVLGLLTAALVFGVVLAVGFEFARVTGSYDYRRFCRSLLGRGWPVFEVAFIIQLLLILSVIGSAAGEMVQSTLQLPTLWGTVALMVLIAILTFNGSEVIKVVLSAWSVVLYGVYLLLFALAFASYSGVIGDTFASQPVGEGWAKSGVLYSGYNLALLPAVLFAVVHLRSRRETVGAGLMGGLLAIIPALLFYIAMMSFYPEIGDEPLPATFLMSQLNNGWLSVLFQIVVFGTFIETGTALLHAVNERLDASVRERGGELPRFARPAVSLAFLVVAIFAGEVVGIIDLIAKGYGLLTLVFIAVLILPLLSLGVARIVRAPALVR